jgi:hypothetical protein
MHDKTVQDCLLRVTQISGRLALALGSSASSLFKGSEKMSTGLDAKIRVEVASWSSVKFRAGQKWYYRSDTQWPNESEISLKHLEAASTQLPAIFSTPSISQPLPFPFQDAWLHKYEMPHIYEFLWSLSLVLNRFVSAHQKFIDQLDCETNPLETGRQKHGCWRHAKTRKNMQRYAKHLGLLPKFKLYFVTTPLAWCSFARTTGIAPAVSQSQIYHSGTANCLHDLRWFKMI